MSEHDEPNHSCEICAPLDDGPPRRSRHPVEITWPRDSLMSLAQQLDTVISLLRQIAEDQPAAVERERAKRPSCPFPDGGECTCDD